jgi:hypothetical protein
MAKPARQVLFALEFLPGPAAAGTTNKDGSATTPAPNATTTPYRGGCDKTVSRRSDATTLEDCKPMGFNPHRRYRRRPLDVALVVATLAITAALLGWALFG